MTNGMDEAALTDWLRDTLRKERLDLEARHMSLLKDFASLQRALQVFPHVNKQVSALKSPPSDDISTKFSEYQSKFKHCSEPEGVEGEDVNASNLLAPSFQDAQQFTNPIISEGPKIGTRGLSQWLGDTLRASSENDTFVHRVVKHKKFEAFFGLVIFLNTIVMAFEAQYNGLGIGHKIGFQSYDDSKENIWVGADWAFEILDYSFGTLYTVELSMKIIGLRWDFLDMWNSFDLLIVVSWYLDKLSSNVSFPIDMMLMRLLRLARLLRLIKLAKTISGVDQLFIMLTALKGSLPTLLWTVILLLSCMTLFAFFLNQILTAYVIEDDGASPDQKEKCFEYFGTFSRSIFSMFELTLANWIPIARFLMNDVNEFLGTFAVLYKLTFGFSVIAVINGCFIKETFKAAAADDDLMIMERAKEQAQHSVKMKKLIARGDTDGDTMLSREEFLGICDQSEMKHWLGAQGLDAGEAAMIFDLIDGRSENKGLLTPEDLTSGVAKLKGVAKSLDVHALHQRVQEVLIKVEHMERLQFHQYSSKPEPHRRIRL